MGWGGGGGIPPEREGYGVHEANRREREVGSYSENSIVGNSKDTKKRTALVRRRKRKTWDPW